MILLIDEEIDEIRREWLSHPLPRKFENLIKAGTKAQLKKVVEWGNELCKEHPEVNYPEKGTHYNKRHDCPVCWQSLKEEVGV